MLTIHGGGGYRFGPLDSSIDAPLGARTSRPRKAAQALNLIIMKMLKWLVAAVLLVCVLGLLLLTFSGADQKSTGAAEPSADEFIAESELISENIPEHVFEIIRDLPLSNIRITNRGDSLSARLNEATLIDGLMCSAAGVTFRLPSGSLFACRLAEETVIMGNLIPKGSLITTLGEYLSSHVFYLPEGTEIQGFTVSGTARERINSPDMLVPVAFYPSGRLLGFYSPSNVEIQGIPCRRSNSGLLSNTPLPVVVAIILHENGNLFSCVLSRSAEIDGQMVRAGGEIIMSEDGELTFFNDSWLRGTVRWVAGFFD